MLSKICLRKNCFSFGNDTIFFPHPYSVYCSYYYCVRISFKNRQCQKKPQEWRMGRFDYDYDDDTREENCYDSSTNIFTRMNAKKDKDEKTFHFCGFKKVEWIFKIYLIILFFINWTSTMNRWIFFLFSVWCGTIKIFRQFISNFFLPIIHFFIKSLHLWLNYDHNFRIQKIVRCGIFLSFLLWNNWTAHIDNRISMPTLCRLQKNVHCTIDNIPIPCHSSMEMAFCHSYFFRHKKKRPIKIFHTREKTVKNMINTPLML